MKLRFSPSDIAAFQVAFAYGIESKTAADAKANAKVAAEATAREPVWGPGWVVYSGLMKNLPKMVQIGKVDAKTKAPKFGNH